MTSTSRQPDFGAALLTLRHLGSAELQELLQNDEQVLQRVRNLAQMRELYSEKEVLLASNKSLAEYNLSLEPRLLEAREKLRSKQNEASQLMQRLRSLNEENSSNVVAMDSHSDPDTLVAILQAAHSELEEQSDKLADEFVHGGGDDNVDNFLDDFLAKRRLAHLRRIKIDKLKQLLSNRGNNYNASSNNNFSISNVGNSKNNSFSSNSGLLQPTRAAPPVPPPAVYNSPLMAQNNGPSLPYPLHPSGMPSGPPF